VARFQLMTAHIINHGRLKALTVVVDSLANMRAGDFVWVGLDASTVSPTMVPLDARAYSMQQHAIQAYGLKPVDRGRPCGVDSIG
jgi:hypothetical protein